MTRLLVTLLAAALTPGLHAGAAKDAAVLAAMKLSEKPNYTWISSVEDDATSYHIEGRTQIGGFTRVNMPMLESIRMRLGRDASTRLEAIFEGSGSCVIATDAGWKSVRELRRRAERDFKEDFVRVAPTPSLPAGPSFGGPSGWSISSRSSRLPRSRFEQDENRPYSNLALAVTPPHEELAIIVSSFATLQASGDTAHGTLTELGAALLLVRDGQEEVEPIAAAGTFRLWMQRGMVVRYSLRLEGVLSVRRREIEVRQSSTTIVKDIGATVFDVPDEARWKLMQ
jgi:hypothetical protein